MRINLVDREPNRRERRKSRGRRKRRRSRTFDATIAPPSSRSQRRPKARYTPARRRRANQASRAGQSETQTRSSFWRGLRWRAVGIRLPAILLLAGLFGAIAYTSTDASFFVYEAQITGNRHIAPETIYQQAEIDEQHIFWIEPQRVANRIAQIPGIRSVRVRCVLPAQVSITVEEREPIMMWRTLSHGGDWWLDEEGVVLPYHGDTKSPEMIFVVDSSPRQLEKGDQIQPQEIVTWVRKLATELPGVRVFYFQSDRGLNFVQEIDGRKWTVYVGDGRDLSQKIQAVQALTDYLAANNIYPRYVDVRWPNLPVYGKAIEATSEEED